MFTVNSLRRISIFSELSDEQLGWIHQLVVIKVYKRGEFIFAEGEPGEAVCFVVSGRVKISTGAGDGREKILHFMEPGQVFGEVVLFGSGPYPATAEVVEDSQVGILRNQQLFSLVREHADLAISLLQLLAKRLRMAQRQVRDLALKDAFTRVGELLLTLADQHGQNRSGGLHLPLIYTREEMANMTGTTRETFTRMLSELRQRGLLQVERNKIVIPSREALRKEISQEV